MKLKQIFSLIISVALTTSCSNDDAPKNIEPELAVGTAADITRNEATLTGHVTLRGTTAMPELWFLYGTTEYIEQSTGKITPDGQDVSVRLTGLTAGTRYYYRLAANSGRATLQSDICDFTTEPNAKPTVDSLTVLSHGPVSLIVRYKVTDDGGEALTETGCYLSANDGTESRKITTDTDEGSNGNYTLRVGGLKQNTKYALRAFASNRSGETIGEILEHTTSNAVIIATAGDLSLLLGDELYDYTSLSFSGQMNGSDLLCIRNMAGIDANGAATDGTLTDIDMADVHIVSGGASYDGSHFTADNIVGSGLFANCSKLRSLILPDETTAIEQDALLNCTSLQTLTVPAAVETLDPSAGCTALEAINVSEANKSFKSVDGVLFDKDITSILWFPLGKTGKYTLPSTVTSIGSRAFKGCLISELSLSDNITDLGIAAFSGSLLEEVSLPASLTTISTGIFQGCGSLKTVHIGSQMTTLYEYVFDGCPLEDLYIDCKTPPVCYETTFSNTAEDIFTACTLHVPTGCKAVYRSHNIYGKFKKITEF